VPWQLVLIHQRLESIIDRLPYDELYALFGGPPAPTALDAAASRKLPRQRFSRAQVRVAAWRAAFLWLRSGRGASRPLRAAGLSPGWLGGWLAAGAAGRRRPCPARL
jgi:hypothetical protein